MNETLAAALAYFERGFSIIPMNIAEKRPALRRWKPYRTERADETRLLEWFGGDERHGIGVIFGAVSGGLASRDFDDKESYRAWATEHRELAESLPTVETRRGRHVYFVADQTQLQALRTAIGKPDGTGAIAYADGELRAGVGCYSVLPPSVHPEGHVYRWLIPLAQLRPVDLYSSGLAQVNREGAESGEFRENRDLQRGLKTLDGGVVGVEDSLKTGKLPHENQKSVAQSLPLEALLTPEVELAIQRTLPAGTGRRHKAVFALARELKAMPHLAMLDVRALRPLLKLWHERALPIIGTKAFNETWFDFIEGWNKVKFPKGQEPINLMFNHRSREGLPEVVLDYEDELQDLVAFCRELQRARPNEPFFLSCRVAGGLLGVSEATTSKWFRGLQHDGILLEVSKGTIASGKASRYRYLGPM